MPFISRNVFQIDLGKALVSGCIVIAGFASDAEAAVRLCASPVTASGDDNSLTVARQRAMAGWIAAASKLGPAFTAWRNATDRNLACNRQATGGHRCIAIARPCGISQDPRQLPPGSTPLFKAPPKNRSMDI